MNSSAFVSNSFSPTNPHTSHQFVTLTAVLLEGLGIAGEMPKAIWDWCRLSSTSDIRSIETRIILRFGRSTLEEDPMKKIHLAFALAYTLTSLTSLPAFCQSSDASSASPLSTDSDWNHQKFQVTFLSATSVPGT
jgi:hypothetical protein